MGIDWDWDWDALRKGEAITKEVGETRINYILRYTL